MEASGLTGRMSSPCSTMTGTSKITFLSARASAQRMTAHGVLRAASAARLWGKGGGRMSWQEVAVCIAVLVFFVIVRVLDRRR